MRRQTDHYEDDGFEKTSPFSKRNPFVLVFLVFLFVCGLLSLWFDPPWHHVEVKEERAIPSWSPHPPLERSNEPLLNDSHGY